MVTGRLNTRLLSRGVNSFTCLAWRTENIQTKCFKINKSKQNKTKQESYLRENYPWSRGVNSFTCLAWRTENIQTKCFKINKSKQNKTKQESYLRENYPWSDHNFCRNSTTLGLYRNDLYRNSLYRKVYYRFTGEFNNPCWTLVLFLSIKPIESWG